MTEKMNVGQIARLMRSGQVILYATDTCLGLGHDVTCVGGRDHLYQLKQMSQDKPVSYLVSSLEMAKEYAKFNDLALRLWSRFMPGALTMLLPARKGEGVVGIRYIPDSQINDLITELGNPISTTSANLSGQPVAVNWQQFAGQFAQFDQVLCLIDKDKDYNAEPSTIISIADDSIKIVRSGHLAQKIVEEFGAEVD